MKKRGLFLIILNLLIILSANIVAANFNLYLTNTTGTEINNNITAFTNETINITSKDLFPADANITLFIWDYSGLPFIANYSKSFLENITTFWTDGRFLINVSWEGNITFQGNSAAFYVDINPTTTSSSTSSTSTSTTSFTTTLPPTTTTSTTSTTTELTTTTSTSSTSSSTTTTPPTTTTSSTTSSTTTSSTTSTSSTSTTIAFTLNLYSPNSNVSNEKKIPINLTTNKIADEIIYIDYEDKTPKEKRLCKNCDEYGFLKEKSKLFDDGLHNLTFKAVKDNDTAEEIVLFLVDSKDPKIRKTLPKRNGYTNGTFTIEWEDDNMEKIALHFNNLTDEKTDCPFNPNENKQLCIFFEDITGLDGGTLEYQFEITDKAGNNDISKFIEVNVDTTLPEITQLDFNINSRRVEFNITVSEEIDLDFIDLNSTNPSFKNLCNNCDKFNKKRTFSKGEHNLMIRATDQASNTDEETISFFI